MRKQNYHKNFKNSYNKDNRKSFKRKEDRPIVTGTSVEVRNDDVNGALRRQEDQKEITDKRLAKQEYYENQT